MKVNVSVLINTGFDQVGYSTDIDKSMLAAFEPINQHDEPLLAYACGGYVSGSLEVSERLKFREEAADYLGRKIAEQLIEYMKKNDSLNGYPVNKD